MGVWIGRFAHLRGLTVCKFCTGHGGLRNNYPVPELGLVWLQLWVICLEQQRWAFGLTEPNRWVLWSFGKFGYLKTETDRLVSVKQVRSRLVRFGLGHDRTNRTRQNNY